MRPRRLRAAEILAGKDMLNVDAFAEMLGTTPCDCEHKRRSGQVLGLRRLKARLSLPNLATRCRRQAFAELAEPHERLGRA